MKCNCYLLLLILNIFHLLSNANMIKQMEFPKDKAYTYISPFSAHAYLNNHDRFSDEYHSRTITEAESKISEYHSSDVGASTITPILTILKDGKLLHDPATECSSNCLACIAGLCHKCEKGFYTYGNACYDSCPFESFADNISLECKSKVDNPVFIKAYTHSRCVNSCGKTFHDCSCNPRCKKSGDCCSDFQFCEIVEESYTTESSIENCKYSSLDKTVCLQCKDNFFYYNNQCLRECTQNTFANIENKICIEKGKCNVLNCEKCDNTHTNKCAHCLNGYFLYEGRCLKSCPVGLRANRINFTCQSISMFSFYWIFPSKSGCKDKCGEHNIQHDCSCRHTCLRRGDCCDNFEKECKNELVKENCLLCNSCINGECLKCKENSELSDDKQCKCKSGFKYDIEEDLCHLDNTIIKIEPISDNKDEKVITSNLDLQNAVGLHRNIKITTKNEENKYLVESLDNKNKQFDESNYNSKGKLKVDIKNNSELSIKSVEVKNLVNNQILIKNENDIKYKNYEKNDNMINKEVDVNNEIDSIVNNEVEIVKNFQLKIENKPELKIDKKPELNIEKKPELNIEKKPELNIEKKPELDIEKKPDLNIKKKEFIKEKIEDKKNYNIKKDILKTNQDKKIENIPQIKNKNQEQIKRNKFDNKIKNNTYFSKTTSIYKQKESEYPINNINLNKNIYSPTTLSYYKNNSTTNVHMNKMIDRYGSEVNHIRKASSIPERSFASNNKQYINKLLSEELLKSFHNVLRMKNPENKNQILNLYMNGNISINLLTGNTNPQMITQNIYNKNSYNSNTSSVQNVGSQNKFLKLNTTTAENHNSIDASKPKKNRKQILHTNHEKDYSNYIRNEFNVRDTLLEKELRENSTRLNNKTRTEINIKPEKSSLSNIKATNYFNESLYKEFFGTMDEDNDYKNSKQKLNINLNNLTNNTNEETNKEKFHVQNNYYIQDHSIKVMNSENPSVITLNMKNDTKALDKYKDIVIINNHQNGTLENNNGTIIINNRVHKKLK